jgi:prepilin peptidase dependent protein B
MLRAHPAPAAAAGRRPARGLSIVETMVGLVIGMVVMAGALGMYVDNLTQSRRLLAEARLTQDLRAAADLIARDLRRAGYWGNALSGTRAAGGGTVQALNPYAAVQAGSTAVSYNFSRDAAENDQLDGAEQFGFRVELGALQMQTANGAWQDVTDARSMILTANGLVINASETDVPLGHLCPRTCLPGTPDCPRTQLRTYTLVLTGRSVRDAAVVRQFTSSVRVRNDRLDGRCPT